jgi:hypothetical protein
MHVRFSFLLFSHHASLRSAVRCRSHNPSGSPAGSLTATSTKAIPGKIAMSTSPLPCIRPMSPPPPGAVTPTCNAGRWRSGGYNMEATPTRMKIWRSIPFRMSRRIVDCPCTEEHTMACWPSATVVRVLQLHGRPSASAGSGARTRRCYMAVRNFEVLSTIACAVGSTVSHGAEAWHSQLRKRATAWWL